MAFGSFEDCVNGMQTATCGAISYLTYVLKKNDDVIDLSYNRDKVYGYVYEDNADEVVEKVITKIALDKNNDVLVYLENSEDEFYYLVTMNILNTFNIVKSLYEYPID